MKRPMIGVNEMRRSAFVAATAAIAFVFPAVGGAEPTGLHETVTEVASRSIPNIPGKRLVSLVVEYPAGARSTPHRHARSAFIFAYVLSGKIRSQVDNEPARVYQVGESWFENPGAHHRISENAGETEPARLLAVFVVDTTDEEITTPDAR